MRSFTKFLKSRFSSITGWFNYNPAEFITIAAESITITVELYYNHGVRGLIANAAFEVMKS